MLNKTLFEMEFCEKEFYGTLLQEKYSEKPLLKKIYIF